MKLLKSRSGKILIILLYVCLIVADVCITAFIILKTGSIIAGLAAGLVLGVGIGILGGELEFREHVKEKHKKRVRTKEPDESKKIIEFPGETQEA